MTRLSAPAEDCLLLVQRMAERQEPASTSGLARGLGVTDSTITAMVQKLAKSRLLNHTPRKEITLTKQGGELARKLIRRHRLIETYLFERLGYSWEDVHAEAEKIEHVVSDRFVTAISAKLGHPEFDPHGDPIPDASGDIRRRNLIALSKLQAGNIGTLARVVGGKPELLGYLTTLGLKLGTKIEVAEVPPFDNIIRLSINGKSVTIGIPIAEHILIES